MSLGVANDGESTDHEQLTQVSIALLGYAAKPLLAAARVLTWHQADPGRQASTVLKGLRVGNRGNHRTGEYRSDTGNLHQAPTDLGRPRVCPHTPIGLKDLLVDQVQLRNQES